MGLCTRNSMAMLWGVRHANTQRQRQRQRQIHLGPEVESHYRPYMCYILGKPWVQGPLLHCSPPPRRFSGPKGLREPEATLELSVHECVRHTSELYYSRVTYIGVTLSPP